MREERERKGEMNKEEQERNGIEKVVLMLPLSSDKGGRSLTQELG